MDRLVRSGANRSHGGATIPRGLTGTGFAAVLGSLCVALAVLIVLAVTLGPADISPATAWSIGTHKFWPDLVTADLPAAHERIVWHIRLPRALLAVLVGATLAIVGTVLQAMVRDPLADPAILGGTSGAAAGAVSVIVLGWAFVGIYTLPVAAFAGGPCTGSIAALNNMQPYLTVGSASPQRSRPVHFIFADPVIVMRKTHCPE